jgi:ankyrin repeat protein
MGLGYNARKAERARLAAIRAAAVAAEAAAAAAFEATRRINQDAARAATSHTRCDADIAALRAVREPPADVGAQVAALRRELDVRVVLLHATAEMDAEGFAARRAPIAERRREVAEELFLDALFIVAQFPGGQIAEAEKCCYAFDVRLCAGLCRATWAEEAFWCGLVRVRSGRHKRTRLMYAAIRGRAARVEWLLARGAPKDAKTETGWTALHVASCSNSATGAFCALLAAGVNVNARAIDGVTPLFASIHRGPGCPDIVRALLDAGANVNAAHDRGATPLSCAARWGYIDTARMLLAAGATVNLLNSDHNPLVNAACYGHTDIVRMLLGAGASVDAANAAGDCALIHAAYRGHYDVVNALLAAGANVNAAAVDGTTALYLAVEKRRRVMVRKLLAAGANVEAARLPGTRPLHTAVQKNYLDIATILVDAGADVNALNAAGISPLFWADTDEMRALLVARGGVIIAPV